MSLKAEDIATELERTIPVMQEEAEAAMQEAVDITHHRLSENAPRGRTGALSEKITALTRTNATGVSGTVRPRATYAGYVNEGSGIYAEYHHPITPKATRGPRARLKFADGSFRRSSKGTPATHFIDRTRDETADEVEDLLAAGAQKATDRLFL
jgi:hypothetical protein